MLFKGFKNRNGGTINRTVHRNIDRFKATKWMKTLKKNKNYLDYLNIHYTTLRVCVRVKCSIVS